MASNHIGTVRIFLGDKEIGTTTTGRLAWGPEKVSEDRPNAVMTHARRVIEGSIALTVTMTAREYWAGRLFLIGGCRLPRGMQN